MNPIRPLISTTSSSSTTKSLNGVRPAVSGQNIPPPTYRDLDSFPTNFNPNMYDDDDDDDEEGILHIHLL